MLPEALRRLHGLRRLRLTMLSAQSLCSWSTFCALLCGRSLKIIYVEYSAEYAGPRVTLQASRNSHLPKPPARLPACSGRPERSRLQLLGIETGGIKPSAEMPPWRARPSGVLLGGYRFALHRPGIHLPFGRRPQEARCGLSRPVDHACRYEGPTDEQVQSSAFVIALEVFWARQWKNST